MENHLFFEKFNGLFPVTFIKALFRCFVKQNPPCFSRIENKGRNPFCFLFSGLTFFSGPEEYFQKNTMAKKCYKFFRAK